MKLEIVLRIHDGQNIHGQQKRYIPVSKLELVIGCVSSLLNSSNQVQTHQINLIILNDHSSDELISTLEDRLNQFNYSWKIIHLEEKGFNYSALKQFEYCKNSNADLIYLVEDDYLHSPTALQEMIDAYISIRRKYKLSEVCIFPYDTPQEYDFNLKEKYFVTREKYRHWKSSTWTTQTFMTSPKVLQEHWKHFEKLAKEFRVIPRKYKEKIDDEKIVWEDTTIGNIWRDCVPVFHPIPSLALHIQFEKERDPYINHLEWWNNYTKIQKIKNNFLYQ
jgi:glycosyltransferase involved in cell wall biosynthesis